MVECFCKGFTIFDYYYIFFFKIRFGENIIFKINVEKTQNGFLPPMCLQMLVENTIQHNETSQAKPLEVNIYIEKNRLFITNPIQPRSDKTESSQTGLKNIQTRYAFFTDEKVEINQIERLFSVSLPLISRK